MTYDAYNAWRLACLQARLTLPPESFETYLAGTKLVEYCQGTLRVAAPSLYARTWLQERLALILERQLRSLVGHAVRVEFIFSASHACDCLDFQI